jgi:uncharacterized membrane protein YgdD (TMEM256/DUF423 family)
MSAQSKTLLCVAALSLLIATLGGAAASHALTGLDERVLDAFRTAVDFQFFHGLGVLGIVALRDRYAQPVASRVAAWLLVAGIVLFCGSIYATTFGAPDWIGSAAPIGGISFMAGWLMFAFAVAFGKRNDTP